MRIFVNRGQPAGKIETFQKERRVGFDWLGVEGQLPSAPRRIISAAMRVERINRISRTVGIVA
jgi:hypothetical protein